MLVYQGTKKSFSEDTENDQIASKIQQMMLKRMNHNVSPSEFRAWNNSMEYMYKVLNDNEIPENCGVAIEYNVPLTAKRVDFILSGYDKQGIGQADIIELKQWETINPIFDQQAVVETYTGGAVRKVAHPSYQAWSYAQVIRDYNETVQDLEIGLHPCAYLHNYKLQDDDPIKDNAYQEYLEEAPLFANGEVSKLREFLKAHISAGDNESVMQQIDSGKIRPSKSLQDALGNMLDGNEEFVLLDDQKVVYEDAFKLAIDTKKASTTACTGSADVAGDKVAPAAQHGAKTVFIVTGGPGTGKSVVAINLLVRLIQRGLTAQYVSKNSAPREVYCEELKGKYSKKNIDSLFRGAGSFIEAQPNSMDVLIVDEAHRLNEKSGLYSNQGENQIKEIIAAARSSIFFIDESQRVTLKDIGSVEEIEKWAKLAGADISYGELTSQFRCNGSDGYLSWLDNVLDIRDTANYAFEDMDYDFEVVDSPEELDRKIHELNFWNKARMLAGYCWEWPTGRTRGDTSYHDITIDSWGRSWNLNDSEPFAIGEKSVDEVGCIHTTQGLEFDHVGVIIGEDMRYENGRVVTDYTKRAKTDQSLRGIGTMAKADPGKAAIVADEIIKNTYRTLMTRGMRGCYVYCVDKGLSEYLKARVKNDFEYGAVKLS